MGLFLTLFDICLLSGCWKFSPGAQAEIWLSEVVSLVWVPKISPLLVASPWLANSKNCREHHLGLIPRGKGSGVLGASCTPSSSFFLGLALAMDRALPCLDWQIPQALLRD